jgi:alkylation response protein AidB-like acyl-CoA dehydrogenase
LLYRARDVEASNSGPLSIPIAVKAKFFATEAAQRIIDTAVQFHGAQGLQHGHIIESLYREVRATRIYEGASEIQLDIIAKRL